MGIIQFILILILFAFVQKGLSEVTRCGGLRWWPLKLESHSPSSLFLSVYLSTLLTEKAGNTKNRIMPPFMTSTITLISLYSPEKKMKLGHNQLLRERIMFDH